MLDEQLGHEKTMTAMLPALTGSNIIYGMGMLEMGMTMSYEQLLIDQEIVRMIRRILQGIPVNKETIALDVIRKVGPAGNYLGERHTLKYMRQELSTTNLINRKMRDNWENAGAKDMAERAREQAIEILENYKPIPLPEDVKRKIRSIVEEGEQEAREMGE
ncbi:trimethylamine methyltransferase family protein [Clostridiales bacterium BAD-6]|uniref:Trimethylamine methyltransferase family protein n=1 Tax=Sinanaerobacter chloroacetimidivorans TaxID=2818044 RepID=A0A8J7W458_9FIRM|nr:trimethylamine methyltransferase family protein [Sinanaerobacter chloroacetimidivorans]